MRGDLNFRALNEQFALPDWLMGVRAGFLTPTVKSGLWSFKQQLQWRFVLSVDENKSECGAVAPARRSAGKVANVGMGLLNPAFQRGIINNSGLAHWYPMDPQANWTVLGTRRSQIVWVYLLYLCGFHLLHYPFENLQRSLELFTIGQRVSTCKEEQTPRWTGDPPRKMSKLQQH